MSAEPIVGYLGIVEDTFWCFDCAGDGFREKWREIDRDAAHQVEAECEDCGALLTERRRTA